MTHIIKMLHGRGTREMSARSLQALDGHADPGKFGRMFPKLEPLIIDDDPLFELATAMKDAAPNDTAGDNPDIPSGFTYLGQFVDHDITLDLTPLDQQTADPLATQNFRTPALDLDSLYGPGPALAPFMYQRDLRGRQTPKLLIGKAIESIDPDGGNIRELPNDLPRNTVGRALIGDERNDENLLVAQTHLAFLKFHNAIVDWLGQTRPGLDGGETFEEARRLAQWHYQWIVLYDLVERLTEKGLINKIRDRGRRFYRFKTRPYIPAEFGAAIYRLGHSMVRESYDHNRVFRDGGLAPGSLELLFAFTGKSGAIIGDLASQADPARFQEAGGAHAHLPSNWVIDWRRFYDFGTAPEPNFKVNQTRRLDPFIVPALHSLPREQGRHAQLAFRNLKRGVQVLLPSGQDIARAMGADLLSPSDIANSGDDGAAAAAHGMHEASPLWYYILKEASVMHNGRRLGPVGSTIIAETFLGLVHGDHESFMWLRSSWKPELPSANPGEFTMVDLLNFVGDVNPVG